MRELIELTKQKIQGILEKSAWNEYDSKTLVDLTLVLRNLYDLQQADGDIQARKNAHDAVMSLAAERNTNKLF